MPRNTFQRPHARKPVLPLQLARHGHPALPQSPLPGEPTSPTSARHPSTSPTVCAAASCATTSSAASAPSTTVPATASSSIIDGKPLNPFETSGLRPRRSRRCLGQHSRHSPIRGRHRSRTRPPRAARRSPPEHPRPAVDRLLRIRLQRRPRRRRVPARAGYIPSNGNRHQRLPRHRPRLDRPLPRPHRLLGYTDLQGAIDFAIRRVRRERSDRGRNRRFATSTPPARSSSTCPPEATLELRAAEGTRPTLLLDGEIVVTGDTSSTVVLNGLLIAAAPATIPASPAPVALVHAPELNSPTEPSAVSPSSISPTAPSFPAGRSTPHGKPHFPDQPTLLVEPAGLAVNVARSILGPVRATDSPPSPPPTPSSTPPPPPASPTPPPTPPSIGPSGGALTLVGCTVIGKVHATLFTLISDSIFWAWLASRRPTSSGRPLDRRPQAGRLRPLQLSAHRRHHSAPLPVRRKGTRHTAAAVFRTALRAPRLLQAARLHQRPHPPRRRRRRRDGRLPLPAQPRSARPTCASACRSICPSAWNLA